MKIQNFIRVALRCAILCVCLLALTAAAYAQAGQSIINTTKSNIKDRVAPVETDPKIVKGLEAAAAARRAPEKREFDAGNFRKNTDSSLVLALFADANKLTSDEVNRGAEVGVIYIGKGGKELLPGYYYVQLLQQPVSAELIYKVTLIPAQTGGVAERRQYQPLLIRKRIDKSNPSLRQVGGGTLDLTTLGGDILAAVEQSIVNTTKSNVKEH